MKFTIVHVFLIALSIVFACETTINQNHKTKENLSKNNKLPFVFIDTMVNNRRFVINYNNDSSIQITYQIRSSSYQKRITKGHGLPPWFDFKVVVQNV